MFCCKPSKRRLRPAPTISPTTNGKFIGAVPYRFENSCFTTIFYPATSNYFDEANKLANENAFLKERKEYSKETGSYYRQEQFFRYFAEISEEKSSYEVIFFSHGLRGHSECCTRMCSELASLGYIVIAFEHEDGTASLAFDSHTKERIRIQRMDSSIEYSRDNVIKFRGNQLKKRSKEFETIYNSLLKPEKLISTSRNFESKLFEKCNVKTGVHLAGHSFGATFVSHLVFNYSENISFVNIFLFDLWAFPLSFEIEKSGLHGKHLNVFSFLSADFYKNQDFEILIEFYKNSEEVMKLVCHILNITHERFTDYEFNDGKSNDFFAVIRQTIEEERLKIERIEEVEIGGGEEIVTNHIKLIKY